MSPDALTGVEPGLAFPGWGKIVRDLERWQRVAPFMVTNGLRAREELLQQPGLDEDRRAWYTCERELFLQCLAGQALAVPT